MESMSIGRVAKERHVRGAASSVIVEYFAIRGLEGAFLERASPAMPVT